MGCIYFETVLNDFVILNEWPQYPPSFKHSVCRGKSQSCAISGNKVVNLCQHLGLFRAGLKGLRHRHPPPQKSKNKN